MPRSEAEIQADVDALREQFRNGEIDAATLNPQLDALLAELGVAVPSVRPPIVIDRFFERLGVAIDAGVKAWQSWRGEV